jgi:hypothetical protein
MSRRKSSSNDNGRNHPYLANTQEQEWQKAKIERGPLIKVGWGHQWSRIIQNGVVVWDSRKQITK